jgi:hypothetical protein
MSTTEHFCRDCPDCDCHKVSTSCNTTCGWDCGCPQYPPPEAQSPSVAEGVPA